MQRHSTTKPDRLIAFQASLVADPIAFADVEDKLDVGWQSWMKPSTIWWLFELMFLCPAWWKGFLEWRKIDWILFTSSDDADEANKAETSD